MADNTTPYIPSNPELQTQSMVDMRVIQQLQDKQNANNTLQTQADALGTALAKGTLNEQQRQSLTSDQLRAIQSSDQNTIANQLGSIKFAQSERGRQLNTNIQFLIQGMSNIRQETEARRQEARQNILQSLDTIGSGAFSGMSDDEKRKLERASGLPTGFIDRAGTSLKQAETKAEEARQLQLRQAQQDYDLQRQKFELDRRQAEQSLALEQAKFAFSRKQATSSSGVAKLTDSQRKAQDKKLAVFDITHFYETGGDLVEWATEKKLKPGILAKYPYLSSEEVDKMIYELRTPYEADKTRKLKDISRY